MAADDKCCPSCGAKLPANTPEGYCPRCLLNLSTNTNAPGRVDVDATTAPATRSSGHEPETLTGDSEATGAYIPGPVAADSPIDHGQTPKPNVSEATGAYIPGSAAHAASSPTDATGDWSTDSDDPQRTTDAHSPPRTADGHSTTQELPRGATVRYFGDYEILKELGRGGMGVVYKARQVSLNRPVALKMIKVGALADDDDLRRFQNEAEAVALLDHPGIVPVYEVGEHDSQRYFSMKLIEGSNLAEQLASFQANPRAAVALLIEAAEAVQHAHMRGILHRDLKPANILLDTQGHPHITDFGLAKLMESDVELTASGAIMGTPAYMSPEQAAGRRGAMSLATDVYGLGAIFYAMLTGKAPFGGDSIIETLDAVRTRPPESPTRRNATIPRDLELICLKCLEKNPADRYPTAAALADDLRRWAAGEPVSVRAAGAVERVAKWARRKPTLAAAYTLGLLAVLLGGLGGAAVWQWRAAARARDVAATARDNEATARATAEKARDGEANARAVAETARDGEATARAAAEKARDGEAAARETLARFEYGLSMEAALQEWREDRLSASRSLLDKAQSDLRGWEWRYMNRLCHSDLLTLKGHNTEVNSAAFSPDVTRIVTGSSDKTARVWDVRTGAELLTLKGNEDRVFSASFSADGSRIVTGTMGKSAKIWDAKTGAEILILKGQDNNFRWASFSPDGSRVITAGGASAKIWDAKTGAELLGLKGFMLSYASFSPDGSRVATADGDGTVKIWEAKTGVELLNLKGHVEGRIAQSVAFSPDGSRVVTASHDGTAKIWDAKTGAEVLTLKGHKLFLLSASFSPDGSRVVTSCFDSTVKVWDAKTGNVILSLRGHTEPVLTASFSPDGSRIVTASMDKTAKVWDAKTDFEVLTLDGDKKPVKATSFSADGSRIITASPDGAPKVRDSRTGTELLTLKEHTGMLRSASFSPDGSRIVATVRVDKPAIVWDAKTGDLILTRTEPGLFSGSFSPDGSTIVSLGAENTARIWDSKTGDIILTLKGHTRMLTSASFSPDGLRVLTASEDKTAKIWDAKTGGELLTLKGHKSHVTSAAFSADGSRVATGCLDKTAKVWNATTGAEIMTLEGRTAYDVGKHAFSPGSASFSPDGSRIVTASGDESAKVWDAKTGAELFTLKAWETGQGWAESVSFSPDGSRIVADNGNALWVWDATPINREFLGRESATAAGTVK